MTELEQHEIERLQYGFAVSRRDLFKFVGAGLVVGLCAPKAFTQESGAGFRGESASQDVDSWLHIAPDSKITVFTGKVEMGQNIRTSLAQQVAEELRAPLNSITMVMGDTALTPFDMGTFGSRSTPQMGSQLRKMAASARELLLDMAARKWQEDRSKLSADNATIISQSGKKIGYGELTGGQKLVKLIAQDPSLTPATQWHVAGTAATKVDGAAFVTGSHQYTSDIARLQMLTGKVLRPNAFNATLVSLDSRAAEALPNVRVIRDGNFVGVVAPDSEQAQKALSLLQAQWNAPAQPSETELFDYLKKNPEAEGGGGFGGRSAHIVGSIETGMSSATKTASGTYTVAYIAHAPLEPRAAVAEWTEDRLTVWTGTQRPFAVREELASAFHVPLDHVHVIVPDTGSAYGGKHTGDAAVEAARLARAAGRPVKLTWTREEEFTWAYFRPAGVIEVKSGARDDGTLVSWEFHNYNSGPAAIQTPYNVPNQKIEFHPTKYPLRQGSYRGLAGTANHFARESHIAELAHVLNIDPLQFRLKNITRSEEHTSELQS